MEITLKEIKIEQKDILEKLLQLYLHNISSDFPMDFNSNTGLYEYDDINKYFENENNKAFFILKENDIAGFILIDILDEKNIIQEIFVLNNWLYFSSNTLPELLGDLLSTIITSNQNLFKLFNFFILFIQFTVSSIFW